MPTFIARVVLHRTDGSDDYTDFHAEMKAIDFEQTIHGHYLATKEKTHRKLPGGTYVFDHERPGNQQSKLTLQEHFDKIKAAVQKVMADEKTYIKRANNPPSIFLVEAASGGLEWAGLKDAPVEK